MAKAFKDAVISGRNSFLAGRMKKTLFASQVPLQKYYLVFFSSHPKSSQNFFIFIFFCFTFRTLSFFFFFIFFF